MDEKAPIERIAEALERIAKCMEDKAYGFTPTPKQEPEYAGRG